MAIEHQSGSRTIPTEVFYTATASLGRVFDRNYRGMGFGKDTVTEEGFWMWRQEAREKLRTITGIRNMESCPLEPELLSVEQMDGYTRQKIVIQTEPGIRMPLYALVPDDLAEGERRACMIAPHGHSSGGKYSPAGRSDIPSVADAIREFNYDYGLQWVRRGYVVFCPDARGFGERREWMLQGEEEAAFLNSTCRELNHIAMSLGQSLTGMWVWDLMRLIDYIVTRPECDPGRIGCGGLSGGGLQTLWLAALDDRVSCAIISGYFYGYKDSLLEMSNNCSCNFVPGLWNLFDMGDLGALIAPRPLFIETGRSDYLNGARGIVNVTEQVEITAQAYNVLGVREKLEHYLFDGGHVWKGDRSAEFLEKWLPVSI